MRRNPVSVTMRLSTRGVIAGYPYPTFFRIKPLHQDIERLSEVELRMLEKFIADLTLPEDDPLPDEVEALSGAFAPDDYVPWQRRTP